MARKPTRTRLSILGQLCNLIPPHLVSRLARESGVEQKCRTFSAWSHVVALLYSQLAHSLSLNDVCDALKNHQNTLRCMRGATAPSRNAFSHANRERDGHMAEMLFMELLAHLTSQFPRFASRSFKMPRRFKRSVHAIDSTVIRLVANCIDWARHRRRKAAAKLHLRLDVGCMLPRVAIVSTAGDNDAVHAQELCANLQAGEIVVFDRAYLNFSHLAHLSQRGVFWVTRTKENFQYKVVKKLSAAAGNILCDQIIKLTGPLSQKKYPEPMRLVRAIVELDGTPRELEFITDNFDWAPSSIAELYKSRWQIEVFFKELKQTLHLSDFLGHNRNAIMWQVWSALITYLLTRFCAFMNSWRHGFRRFFCLLRSCLWMHRSIPELITCCGTAGESPPLRAAPDQLYLPGFGPG